MSLNLDRKTPIPPPENPTRVASGYGWTLALVGAIFGVVYLVYLVAIDIGRPGSPMPLEHMWGIFGELLGALIGLILAGVAVWTGVQLVHGRRAGLTGCRTLLMIAGAASAVSVLPLTLWDPGIMLKSAVIFGLALLVLVGVTQFLFRDALRHPGRFV